MRERTRLDAVTHPPLNSPTIVLAEHRNWTLQAHWFHSFRGATEGWVCYVTGPNSSHKLNIGRWPTSDLAFEHGRAHIDRRVDAANQAAARPGVPKLRHQPLR